MITFKENNSVNYADRTIENIRNTDVTICFACDYNTAGEKCTYNNALKMGKPIYRFLLNKASVQENSKTQTNLINHLKKTNKTRINIAGNGSYTFKKYNYTQKQIDDIITKFIQWILQQNIIIKSITTGGQTGADEAGLKAALANGIPAICLAPKNWRMRDINNNDISNETKFKARFNEYIKTTKPRIISAAEKKELQKTTYAPGVRRRVVPEHGPIQIVVTWEYYSKNLKKWVQSTSATWEYKTMQAAIDYITNGYLPKLKAKNGKPSKRMNGKEFFLTANGRWVEVKPNPKDDKIVIRKDAQGKEKHMKFLPYDNADWDNGVTFYSQWIVEGGKYLRRVTFEQYKEVSTDWKRDYHDPKQNPWSHTDTVTITTPDGRTSKRSVRTYLGEDAPDTTLQRKNARSATKRAIQREYDEHRRHELAMSPEEYAVYKDELMSLPDEEWQKKYGRNDRIVDYL